MSGEFELRWEILDGRGMGVDDESSLGTGWPSYFGYLFTPLTPRAAALTMGLPFTVSRNISPS